MPSSFTARLLRNPQLNRVGQLMEATRQIQRTLAGLTAKAAQGTTATPDTPPAASPAQRRKDRDASQGLVIDAVLREVHPSGFDVETDFTPEPPQAPDRPQPSAHEASSFKSDVFASAGTSYPYRLYIPSAAGHGPLPLIVLLHGCTQTATDFALGTAMNQLAEQEKCVVLYPEQLQRANSSRCWNWFEPRNQQRGSGEPGMIAALTQHVMAGRNIDANRVYITGLSAGGAMAAVVAGLYPDLFAAVGVHSGLPCGAAHDIPSAFSVMRSGNPPRTQGKPRGGTALPTIVFHGTADKTVHPDNGEHIVNAAVKAVEASGKPLARSEVKHDGGGARTARRTRFLAEDGTPWVEHWEVASGPHGWSGGDTKGSYTDPTGPSASAAMLEFFLQHRKQGS